MIFNKTFKFYSYIYFRCYAWNNYLWDNKETAAFNSTLGMTFSLVSLIASLILIIDNLFGTLLSSLLVNVYISVSLVGFIFLIHFSLFEYKQKYLKIEANFIKKSEPKNRWIIKGFFVWSFLLAPILIMFLLLNRVI